MSFLLSPVFSVQQHRRTRGQNRFCLEVGEVLAQTMYIHVSKCKNDKITERKTKRKEIT
jgi:hypothetical protein